jgi:molecular chaperone GrpE
MGENMDPGEKRKTESEENARLAEERLNQLQYLQADFDNYRRLCAKEKEQLVAFANEQLIQDLLAVLDDFERALPSLENEKNREGMLMVFKNLKKILAHHGLEPIECVGKKFDPYCHEALCREPCDKPTDTVLEDLGKGYRLKTKVIRPSKVKIAEQIIRDNGDNYE